MTESGRRARFGPGFRSLWTATALTGLGDGFRIAALAVFAATLTSSTLLVAAVAFASRIPWIVIGPLSGALADRVQPLRALTVSTMVRAAVTIAFAVVVFSGLAQIWILIVVAFVLSSIDTLAHNASQALIPLVRGERSLESANSLSEGSQTVATDLVGTPVGPLLFAVHAGLPFGADAALSVGAVPALYRASRAGRLRTRPTSAVSGGGLTRDALDGLRWLWAHRRLRILALTVCVLNISSFAVASIAVLYAIRVLDVPGRYYGLLLLVIGLGGVVGLVATPWCTARLGRLGTLRLSFAVCPVGFLVGGLTSDAVVAVAALSLVGFAVSAVTVVTISIRQDEIPPEMFGSVNGSFRLIVNGVSPIVGVVVAAFADVAGLRFPFFFSAAVMLVATVAVFALGNGMESSPTP